MKPQITKKVFAFIIIIISSGFILLFFDSCKKENSSDVTKTTDSPRANTSASSGIIYSDINPDIMLACTPTGRPSNCSSSYSLDLNNDGIIDFSITYSYSKWLLGVEGQSKTTIAVKITCKKESAVATDLTNPLAMNSNDIISSALSWKSDTVLILNSYNQQCSLGCFTFYGGNWFSTNDKILGLQLKKGGKIFYGWALLSGNARTIRSYAFNSTSNQPILAGQTK